ncbi:putative calcineurin-like phosphoesterase [Mytilinidion resinicola]|uniref:Calcineurin-like phosphoesterase n=1 Tax=Mytilinidion resinicola TaxID=574789 RepID=A0A6A6YT81_9PEZI|nr:putative calcineurin-like phosphoesterase [Mytilinidion resinicola]KAF2811117.1 putative calcineurin-like phosphoesterase [Mytilinidion resinicola]
MAESSPVQLQLMSDLHLETPVTRPTYSDFFITPQCPNLALLGDIGNVVDNRLLDFLQIQVQHFEIVFFLLGNHEPYDSSFPVVIQRLREFEKEANQAHQSPDSGCGRFVFLDQTRFDISDSVTILGCTFFSRIADEQKESVARFVSDFEEIEGWTIRQHNAAHEDDLAWLNAQVAAIEHDEPWRAIVVLTHHSPTLAPAANDARHLEDENGVRSAFVTDVSREQCWKSKSVRVWAFGHTHFNCDFEDEQTGKRVVANQKGYSRTENATFDADKVVKIEGMKAIKMKWKATNWKATKRKSHKCVVQ